ncbi:uncharacterized protein LOC135487414 [Lineus longissimus]|uniref:uncharacterized protein LOC135487414 n=1 Tax=Lineus longissimus TaxID=88925 RepID=UPI002B4DAC9F
MNKRAKSVDSSSVLDMESDDHAARMTHQELFVIYNFFEHIPPPPLFRSFKEGFLHVAHVIQQHPQFVEGMLLRDVNERPRFPYINYAVFNTTKQGSFQHDPSWIKVIHEGHGNEQIHHQAGFIETRTLGAPDVTSLPKQPSNQMTAYLVTAFKAEGDPDRLDKMWATWSGADFVQAHLAAELQLKRITLHKRIVQHGTFMYVLMCELGAGVTYLNRARDFVERLNERKCGFSALYVIDERY